MDTMNTTELVRVLGVSVMFSFLFYMRSFFARRGVSVGMMTAASILLWTS